jgi:hypothetical protein
VNMLSRVLSALLLITTLVAAPPVFASNWSAAVVTGVSSDTTQLRYSLGYPEGDQLPTPSYVTFDYQGGTATYQGHVLIAVTAPTGSAFNCMSLRAYGSQRGYARADVYRQPWKSFRSSVKILGRATTTGVGGEVVKRRLPFPITWLNPTINTYFIHITLVATLSPTSSELPRAYDVVLSQETDPAVCPIAETFPGYSPESPN